MLDRIVAIQVEPNYRLRLTYEDKAVITADFNSVIRKCGVFLPLADPTFFSQAALDVHGRAVVWPGELEFCADALRLEWGRREPYQSYSAPQRQVAGVTSDTRFVEDM